MILCFVYVVQHAIENIFSKNILFFSPQSINREILTDRGKGYWYPPIFVGKVTLFAVRVFDKLRDTKPWHPKIQFWTRGACNGIVRRPWRLAWMPIYLAACRYMHIATGQFGNHSRSVVDYRMNSRYFLHNQSSVQC